VPPVREDIGGKTSVKIGRNEEPLLRHGFFRNPANDEDLLSKFGLHWWIDVDPVLDNDGRLSVRQSERLLRRLKEHESKFAFEMLNLPESERGIFLRRYKMFRDFLQSAIRYDSPIDFL